MIFTDNTIYSHLRTVRFPAEGLLYHIISTGVLRFLCNYLDGRRLSEAMPGGDAGRGGFVRRQSTEIYVASETGNICVEDSASLRYFVNILNR